MMTQAGPPVRMDRGYVKNVMLKRRHKKLFQEQGRIERKLNLLHIELVGASNDAWRLELQRKIDVEADKLARVCLEMDDCDAEALTGAPAPAVERVLKVVGVGDGRECLGHGDPLSLGVFG